MDEEITKQLAQLKQAYESGILDEDTYQAAIAALSVPVEYRAEVGSGAAAQGSGATAVGERGVFARDVKGDIITGDVYYGEPTQDPAEALRIYRGVLVRSSSHLPLRGVDIEASDPAGGQKQLGLANVYIDLDTTSQVEVIGPDATDKSAGALARDLELVDLERISQRDMRPLPALEAAAGNKRLVLLGDPGGGKSTFVYHLAHCLSAHVLEPAAGWLEHLPQWPQEDAGLLPVVIILRDFAGSLPDPLPKQATPQQLWSFIEDQLANQNLSFASDVIRGVLEEGEAMVLLDGLDEVPSAAQRAFVRDAVAAFADRYPGNRYLVTCRVLAYQPPEEGKADLRLLPEEDYPTFELALFDEEKIDRFITAWYHELVRLGTIRTKDGDSLTRELQGAIRRPDLWRLAPNPLLLTVMALVHTHKGRLPDARALLYEDTVNMLLWQWEQVKAGGREEAVPLRKLLLEAGRSEIDLKGVLGRLAFEAHGRIGEVHDGESLADIRELSLTRALAALKDEDWNWARAVIEAIKIRAGLLLERAPGLFTFPHRTFQEYLAGAHLAAQTDFDRQACRLAEEGALWREVILLATGRLVYLSGDTGKPLALVAELCPSRGDDEVAAWRKAWLAGDVLQEMGVKRVRDSELGREMLERTRNRLAELVAQGRLAPRERSEAGDTLGALGDPRPGVGVRQVGELRLPAMQLCFVPPGPFWMGSPEDDPEAREDEKPLHKLDIPYAYWIGRYPVTVAQFRAFADQSGQQPQDPESLRDSSNRPVRWITWYEALAFCHWLSETWREAGWLPEGWQVTLPSEAEWEKAARGGLQIPEEPLILDPGELALFEPELPLASNPHPQRRYPWGEDLHAKMANFEGADVHTTCAVGTFPGDLSPLGVEDLAGNVTEWTRTCWGDEFETPSFNYPYELEDGRERLESGDLRVIRGGNYIFDQRWLRCASRRRIGPNHRNFHRGFRVVVSPLPGP